MEQRQVNGLALGIVLVVSFGFMVAVATLLYISLKPTPQMYAGRVKLMLRTPLDGGKMPSERDYRAQTEDLVVLASSGKTLISAAKTLQELQATADPEGLLRNVEVRLIPRTHIIQAEVTSSSPEEARIAADVIARQIQISHGEATGREGSVKVVDEAYVSPVDQRKTERLRAPALVFVFGLVFLSGVGIGALLRKR